MTSSFIDRIKAYWTEDRPDKDRIPATCYYVAPTPVGNPVTAITVNDDFPFLFTGQASGAVCAWQLDHLLSRLPCPRWHIAQVSAFPETVVDIIMDYVDGPMIAQTLQTSIAKPTNHERKSWATRQTESLMVSNGALANEMMHDEPHTSAAIISITSDSKIIRRAPRCRVLCAGADDGIRGIYIKGGTIYATIGYMGLNIWEAFPRSLHPRYVPFDRPQVLYSYMKQTYTLQHANLVVILTADSDSTNIFQMDIDTLRQKLIPCGIPKNATPVSFDGRFFIWMETRTQGRRVLKIWQYPQMVLVAQMAFSRADRAYWGFQMSANRIVHVSGNEAIKVHELTPRTPRDVPRDYTVVGGASVVRLNIVDGDANGVVEHRKQDSSPPELLDVYTHKYTLTGISAHVVAFLFHKQGQELLLLSSDGRLKVYDLSVSETHSVRTFYNLKGSFRLGIPYLIHVHHPYLFYSCDEGVYALDYSHE